MPGDGSNGVIRARPKAGKCLGTGPTVLHEGRCRSPVAQLWNERLGARKLEGAKNENNLHTKNESSDKGGMLSVV
ncbi:hypothetical protein Y032_0047g1482 [Ancylostoma ceylanicum]|uniref:Uncharacterized protein n=1 Tax=Ancylostoma ceylanicum TaxID=53326 RepID=A0A016UB95_9BILA|nr:hypothetical protein Y032_0047g1482 [Ancylostoma ceylanicum]